MGVVNPPERKKYFCHVDGELEKGFDHWKKTAKDFKGSWWNLWSEKLKKNSGKQITAPQQEGNKEYKVLEPAPGTYVKEKC
jgi:polyhydroxyalkanoate synthase